MGEGRCMVTEKHLLLRAGRRAAPTPCAHKVHTSTQQRHCPQSEWGHSMKNGGQEVWWCSLCQEEHG